MINANCVDPRSLLEITDGVSVKRTFYLITIVSCMLNASAVFELQSNKT